MGYVVSTVFAVPSNDRHSFFVYYVPARDPYRKLATDWINDWVHSNFGRLASFAGPNGVVILPHKAWGDDDYKGIGYCLFENFDDGFLHGKMPFLIISRVPLEKGKGASQAIAINLVKCENERELELVFDNILDGIRRNDWQSIIDNFPLQAAAKEPEGYGGWYSMLNKVVQLKPNLFGIGLNLNEAIELAGNTLADQSAATVVKKKWFSDWRSK